jgi:hypothetical protein
VLKLQKLINKNEKLYPAWKHLSVAAVPVNQISVVRGGEIHLDCADFERDAICAAYDGIVIAADNVPRWENSDARWTPNTAVGG